MCFVPLETSLVQDCEIIPSTCGRSNHVNSVVQLIMVFLRTHFVEITVTAVYSNCSIWDGSHLSMATVPSLSLRLWFAQPSGLLAHARFIVIVKKQFYIN